jgi:hypothetical protein
MKLTTIISGLQAPAIGDINEDMFNIFATILVVAMSMVFVLSLVKKIFAQHLKKKIIESGIPESLAASVLNSGTADEGDSNLKWCLILAWLGVGLAAVHYTTPLGLHSLAILSFCLAAGFLCYFIYTKKVRR